MTTQKTRSIIRALRAVTIASQQLDEKTAAQLTDMTGLDRPIAQVLKELAEGLEILSVGKS